jgi:hypothetical protein
VKTSPDRKPRTEKRLAAPAMVDFLRIDTQTGLIFSGIALGTRDLEKKRRTTRIARNAYDTVVRLKIGIALTERENSTLQQGLERLKDELEILGEHFS